MTDQERKLFILKSLEHLRDVTKLSLDHIPPSSIEQHKAYAALLQDYEETLQFLQDPDKSYFFTQFEQNPTRNYGYILAQKVPPPEALSELEFPQLLLGFTTPTERDQHCESLLTHLSQYKKPVAFTKIYIENNNVRLDS